MAESLRHLRAARLGEVAPRLVCKRPPCANTVERKRGRPAQFCSGECQSTYQRERDEVRRQLRDFRQLAAQYEIDLEGSSVVPSSRAVPQGADRPTGQLGSDLATLEADQVQQVLLEVLHSIQLAIVQPSTDGARLRDDLASARDRAYARLASAGSTQ